MLCQSLAANKAVVADTVCLLALYKLFQTVKDFHNVTKVLEKNVL